MKHNKQIIIVGGGTAGLMTASILSKYLPNFNIILIKDNKKGIGVGEATIPGIKKVFRDLNLSEKELLKSKKITIKLGNFFKGWRKKDYFHSFYLSGGNERLYDFLIWNYFNKLNKHKIPFGDFLYHHSSIIKNYIPELEYYNHSYHLDTSDFTSIFLNFLSIQKNVKLKEAKVNKIILKQENIIDYIVLDTDEKIKGNLYIDCTGFNSFLLKSINNTNFIEFNELAGDTALVIKIKRKGKILPFTTSEAYKNGWIRKIPLSNKRSFGYIHSSSLPKEKIIQEFYERLITNNFIKKTTSIDFKVINFKSGYHKEAWKGNVIAFGLSYGFIEPLESTGLSLTYSAVYSFLEYFKNGDYSEMDRIKYNINLEKGIKNRKNFILFHYLFNELNTDFWKYTRSKAKIIFGNYFDSDGNLLLDTLSFEDISGKNIEYFSVYSYMYIYSLITNKAKFKYKNINKMLLLSRLKKVKEFLLLTKKKVYYPTYYQQLITS